MPGCLHGLPVSAREPAEFPRQPPEIGKPGNFQLDVIFPPPEAASRPERAAQVEMSLQEEVMGGKRHGIIRVKV